MAILHFRRMGGRRSKLTDEQIADAGRLKRLFEQKKGKFSQESFGAQFGIGNQGMVGKIKGK